MQSAGIHPTAVVAPGAVIGEGTTIGPYCVIGPHVVLGKGNRLLSHTVIEGHTAIADQNTFYQFSSVGAHPQDLKYRGEPSELRIGSHNTVREGVTLQPGTEGGGMLTSIGDHNLFMANSHVGHDSTVGSRCVFANCATIAGHVIVEDSVILGGLVGVHQFARIGNLSMLGAGAMVSQDIPPFCIAQGDHAELIGLNKIGLTRAGFGEDAVSELTQAFKALLLAPKGSGTLRDRLASLREASGNEARHALANQFLDFFIDSGAPGEYVGPSKLATL
jgi:UDP-N-acetylglucosamine acyltransferase